MSPAPAVQGKNRRDRRKIIQYLGRPAIYTAVVIDGAIGPPPSRVSGVLMNAFITGGSGFTGGHLISKLSGKGYRVRALARSEQAAAAVEEAGAEAVRGDLSDEAALVRGMRGCETTFHVAAKFDLWGRYDEFHEANVKGTERVISAALDAGIRSLVQVGAAAVVMGKASVPVFDESFPLQYPAYSPYVATKALAEEIVLAANSPRLVTSVVRPSLIWGVGDHTLPTIAGLVRKGQFAWIDRGDYPFVTTHVGNVCHGAILAAEVGRGGQAYFLTDGDVIRFRDLVVALLETQGVDPPGRSYPYGLAWGIAGLMEFAWEALRRPGSPPLTRTMVRLSGRGFVASDAKARAELGYAPVVSRTDGLSQLKGEATAIGHGETTGDPGHVRPR